LHPSHMISKVYRVRTSRRLKAGELSAFARGITLEDGAMTQPAPIRRLEGASIPTWYEVVLREGRKRQIRAMMQHFAVNVLQLIRIGMGPLRLAGLPEGRWRRLSLEEVKALRAACGIQEEPDFGEESTGATQGDC